MPPPVDVSEIRKEGWIQKESAVIRTFRKRWMVLTPDHLYSFKGEKKYADPTEVCETRAAPTQPHAHTASPSTTEAELGRRRHHHRRSTCASVARSSPPTT